ncbi:hypothetical protein HPB47_007053 [Ixodes persulcatus]|uniref:Uncharacterized protein n=1 Tax=Ixodes persulcatus TaxID=34615 RepID=A0AC60P8Y6_IXOPE|nr:hypothetical protein HPB47_007053 [Ixodes persulcatus]
MRNPRSRLDTTTLIRLPLVQLIVKKKLKELRLLRATDPLGGQRLSPTSASGLYSEVPTSAEDPLTTSPSREPIQAEPIPGTVPSPEGYAAGDSSLETPSPGAGAAPLPATKSTRHVATWTWQQGTGPPHGFVSWRGWSEQRRPRPGVPGDKLPPLFRGRTVQDADREAQGASMTPDPAAVYCEGCGVLRINEIPDVSKLHRSRVRVPEVVPPPDPPDLHAALDQPGAVDAVLSYMARRPEFAAAILDGSLFRMPVDVAMDGVSGEAAPSAPALSPEEERQLTEEILQF